MPVSISLVNLTNDTIHIDDLGTRLLGPSGTAFNVTGFFLPEELQQSQDLQALAVSGSVTLSGAEGITPVEELELFFQGSQFQTQNFTTDGRDLRALRNTIVEGSDHVVVTSGVDVDDVVTYTVATAPQVVTDALVGTGAVTVTSGSNTITIDAPTAPAFVIDGDGIVYLADASRGDKQLSVGRDSNTWGRPGNQKSAFLGMHGVNNSDIGWEMIRDATITAIIAGHTNGSMDLEILVDGAVAYSETNLSPGYNEFPGLNIDVDLNQTIQIFLSNNQNVRDPNVWLELAWRLE